MARLPDHRPEPIRHRVVRIAQEAKLIEPRWKRELLARAEANKPKVMAKVIAGLAIRGPKRPLPK